MKKKIFISICYFLLSACQFKNNKYAEQISDYYERVIASRYRREAEYKFSVKHFLEAVFDEGKDIDYGSINKYEDELVPLDKMGPFLKKLNRAFQYYDIIEDYIAKYIKMLEYGYKYYFISFMFFTYSFCVPKSELYCFCEQYKQMGYLISGYSKKQFSTIIPKVLQNLIQEFYNSDFIFPSNDDYRSFFINYDNVCTIHVDRASYEYAKQYSLELYLNVDFKLPHKYYHIDNYEVQKIKTEKKLKLHSNGGNRLVSSSLPIRDNSNLNINNNKPEEGCRLIIRGFDLSELINPNSVIINIIKFELNNIKKTNKKYDWCDIGGVIEAMTGCNFEQIWDMLYKNREKLGLSLVDGCSCGFW